MARTRRAWTCFARRRGPSGCLEGSSVRVRAHESGPDLELTGPQRRCGCRGPEPQAAHAMTPGEGVLVDVHAAGVSFPEVLQSRGEYQVKPELPFVPGSEVGGVVRSAPAARRSRPGDRVAAFACWADGPRSRWRRRSSRFRSPTQLDFAQGAGLVLNYHTAYFSLATRGRLRRGETVLVHGAAGGVGTAALQVAQGLGARTIAVVSSDEKEASRGRRAPTTCALRRPVEGPGQGALGRRGRPRDRPGRRRPVHRQPPLAPGGRPRGRGRVHRRLDPRGQGQPAAAGQHRGDRRRLGQLRDPQAGAQPGDRGGDRAADRAGLRTAGGRREVPARAGRGRARADRRAAARPARSSWTWRAVAG